MKNTGKNFKKNIRKAGICLLAAGLMAAGAASAYADEGAEYEAQLAEQAALEEASRIAAEQAALEEASRIAAEQAALEEASRIAAEQAALEEASRIAAEQAALEEAERLAIEEAARQAAEEAARQAAEEAESRAAEEESSSQEEAQTSAEAEDQTTSMALKGELGSVPLYANAGETFYLYSTVTGGMSPYSLDVSLINNEKTIARSSFPVPEESDAVKIPFSIIKGGDYQIMIKISDASGSAVTLKSSVPVSDSKAVEKPEEWEIPLKELILGGTAGEDLLKVARTQLGYKESGVNFQIREEGVYSGYTRYGDWDGDSYEPWNDAFVRFCLAYAGINSKKLEHKKDSVWTMELSANGAIASEEGFKPEAGDLVIFRAEKTISDHRPDEEYGVTRVGIITGTNAETTKVIEGDAWNGVVEAEYGREDKWTVIGYVDISSVTGEDDDEAAGAKAEEASYEDGSALEEENAEEESPEDYREDLPEAEVLKDETGYTVEYEGLIIRVIPEDPAAIPEGASVSVLPLTMEEALYGAKEDLRQQGGEGSMEIRSAAGIRIIFTDAGGNEIEIETAFTIQIL